MTARPAPRRAVAVVLVVVHLALLAWVVLWKLEPPWTGDQRVVKLVPFVATGTSGPSAPLEVLANVVLFLPFGALLGVLAGGRGPRRIGAVTRAVACGLTCAVVSVGLEVGQYALGVGRSDATDVVANTTGGLLGAVVVLLVRSAFGPPAGRLLARGVVTATAAAVLVAGLGALSPLRLVHVRDAGPLARSADGAAPGAVSRPTPVP